MNGTSDGHDNQREPKPSSVTGPDPVQPVDSGMKLGVVEQQAQQSVIHASETSEKERARHDDLIDRINKSERLMLGLTAVIALTGIWGGWVIYKQLQVTEGQLAEMKSGSVDTKTIAESAKTQADNTTKLADATETLAIATQSSVKQARASLDAYIDTARLDQRAWVGAVNIIKPAVKPNTTTIFGVTVTNMGRTPARELKGQVVYRVLSKHEGFAPIYPKITTKHGSVVLQPGMSGNWKAPPQVFTQAEINEFAKGDKVAYLFGKLHYEDIFKQRHRTTFCVYFAAGFSDARSCDTYNEAD